MIGLQDRVFISFSSADRKIARAVCDDLEKRGFACWISSRDVRGGENYQEAIVQALRAVKVMILVFSENANGSNEIKKELALASQTNTVVIPFRVENAVPNAALAYELATRQWIDAFEDRDEALRILGERISSIVTVDGGTPSAPQPRTAEPVRRSPAARAPEAHKKPILPRIWKWYVSETRKSIARTSKIILPMFGFLIGATVIMAIVQGVQNNEAASRFNGPQSPFLNEPQQLINSGASSELLQAMAARNEIAKMVDEKEADLKLAQSYYDRGLAAKSDKDSLLKLKSAVDNAKRDLAVAQARYVDAKSEVQRLQTGNRLLKQ